MADGTAKDTAMFRRSLSQVENQREGLIRNISSLEGGSEVPRRSGRCLKNPLSCFLCGDRHRRRAGPLRTRLSYARGVQAEIHRRLEARRATDIPRKMLVPLAPLFRDLERDAETVLSSWRKPE